MAGWGAAVNTAPVRQGDTVAVHRLRRRRRRGRRRRALRRRAAGHRRRPRRPQARSGPADFGATHTVNAGSGDVVAQLRELTGGFGPDVVIDAVGRPETFRQAFDARDLAGTAVLVGVPDPTMTFEIPLIEVFGHGGAVKSSWYGDCLPERDFPLLIDLWQQGRFPLDRFVSERIGAGRVEEAFHKMERGEVLRSVVVLVTARVEHLVTSGTFSLDGQTFDVDNNVWLLGDDDEVLRHRRAARRRTPSRRRSATARSSRSSARTPTTTTCASAPELAERLSTEVLLHPDDRVLWDLDARPARARRRAARRHGARGGRHQGARAAHPRPRARRRLLLVPDLGVVFSGDTLFSGGPGATGRSYSDYPTILDSIRTRLFALPPETVVHTGHGDDTTVGAEAPSYDEWVRRGG